MSEVEQLHEQAMDIAEEAFIAKRANDLVKARELFLRALDIEQHAASFFALDESSEPTRSILYRSAAALAYHAKEYDRAEQLVSRGLAGSPPPEIKDELRALQDDINFHYHISLKGAELAKNEMQMILWGNATGYGIIQVDLLIKHIEQIKKIFYRTVERLTQQPYRIIGGPSKETTDKYNLYLNGFVPGSFGVSFSIGEPVTQLPLFPDQVSEKIEPQDIIEEVITCFELLQENELKDLQERFDNEDYYQNFVGVARQMAPDGNSIKAIGLASLQNGVEKIVGLTRNKKEIPNPLQPLKISSGDNLETREVVHLTGMLKVADSLKIRRGYGTVSLLDTNNRSVTVHVPVTQMQDVVQPFFDEYVTVTGYRMGRLIYFSDIELAGEKPNNSTQETNSMTVNPINQRSLFK